MIQIKQYSHQRNRRPLWTWLLRRPSSVLGGKKSLRWRSKRTKPTGDRGGRFFHKVEVGSVKLPTSGTLWRWQVACLNALPPGRKPEAWPSRADLFLVHASEPASVCGVGVRFVIRASSIAKGSEEALPSKNGHVDKFFQLLDSGYQGHIGYVHKFYVLWILFCGVLPRSMAYVCLLPHCSGFYLAPRGWWWWSTSYSLEKRSANAPTEMTKNIQGWDPSSSRKEVYYFLHKETGWPRCLHKHGYSRKSLL
jgi:hypothetical protein